MDNPKVCILVLNWNGANDTIECLNSLQKLTYANTELVVIDNGSDDDSVVRIKQAHPQIELLELPRNLLYGGGNNAGLEWTRGRHFDYLIFLNNDTTVEADFVEPLLEAFQNEWSVGMAAPLMCYSADPDLVWYGGGIVNLWSGVVAHRHIRANSSAIRTDTQATDYITGCCLMLPTELAHQMGGFDPAFKMYGEDVDLSLRCRAAGYQLAFVPQSKIYHKVSASIGGEFGFSKLKRKLRGMLQIYARHAHWYQWITILFSQIFMSFGFLMTYLKHRTR
ncbi:MAG: glycosyltransferase family 2 protein [Candidatus Marinimicrobia bacterium]|nr:glycosyltransferase family 2 protein [Candidatus Neomarinimicrobiota bacterium]